jgi:hypothetical protein
MALRGRPPIAQADRKANNLTFRTRGDMRSKLEEAAQKSGRSISEEIEARLERSFVADEVREAVAEALSDHPRLSAAPSP